MNNLKCAKCGIEKHSAMVKIKFLEQEEKIVCIEHYPELHKIDDIPNKTYGVDSKNFKVIVSKLEFEERNS